MSTRTAIPDADVVRIIAAYYDAVDSGDAARVSHTYLAAPTTTLQFNADDPIVTVEAIQEFTARFFHVVSDIAHTMIDIWTTPLMGNVVPVNLAPARSASTVTVVSTALPTFSVDTGSTVTRLALPATSIFTIDIASGKFVSVHNMFDIAKVYAAVNG
ncbi:hypothetical protein ABZ915_28960 [Streptomyces sp. NPDC046915]|uniref:hypothetical protein n=1 Tax=Streptomyces sp. NPDC046915 TaxID=3155257 RepID=UPI0033DF3A49